MSGPDSPWARPCRTIVTVTSAIFSPDGRRIVVTASSYGMKSVWDAATGERLAVTHRLGITSAVFSPDGRQIVTFNYLDRAAQVWDAGTGQSVAAPLLHEKFVTSAAFSPDGRRIVTASQDRTARLWDAVFGLPGWRAPAAPVRSRLRGLQPGRAPDCHVLRRPRGAPMGRRDGTARGCDAAAPG